MPVLEPTHFGSPSLGNPTASGDSAAAAATEPACSMYSADGVSLTCHIRTVEVCRELTAAIAALACREASYKLPQPPAAGAQSPQHAPVDCRLPTLTGHEGVVTGTWGVQCGVLRGVWQLNGLPAACASLSGHLASSTSCGLTDRTGWCCCAGGGGFDADVGQAEAQVTLLVLKVCINTSISF